MIFDWIGAGGTKAAITGSTKIARNHVLWQSMAFTHCRIHSQSPVVIPQYQGTRNRGRNQDICIHGKRHIVVCVRSIREVHMILMVDADDALAALQAGTHQPH